MFPPQGSPALSRRQLRALLALTFFAWAMQAMPAELVHGQDAQAPATSAAGTPMSRPVDCELRAEATVMGAEIRFAQVVRWSDTDADVLQPLADLVVARFDDRVAIRKLTLEDIKTLLTEAGVNTAPLNFSGPRGCTVSRSDATFEPGAALKQFGDATETNDDAKPAKKSLTTVAPEYTAEPDVPRAHVADNPFHTLRELLIASLADKTGLPVGSLQVTFRKEDENLLKLVEPHFDFRIEPQRAGNLGDVSWSVTIAPTGHMGGAGSTDKTRAFIKADARAWQDQVVLAKPLAAKQLIAEDDVEDRHTLVDHLGDAPPVRRDQVVGRMAARELRPGVVMTEKLLDIATLIKPGQIVNVTLARGGVSVTTVARAIDAGTLGQSVRVKSEGSKEIFRVQVTGQQEATLVQ